MKSTWSLIAAGAVIIAALFVLSIAGKKAPFIPIDSVHDILTSEAACISCHAKGKQAPLKPDHPPKEQCLVCHRVKRG